MTQNKDTMPDEIELGLFYAPAPMSENYYSVISEETKAMPRSRAKYIKADRADNPAPQDSAALGALDRIEKVVQNRSRSSTWPDRLIDLKTIRAALAHTKPVDVDIPADWHVSWLGYSRKEYMCQMKRHNIHEDEPDNTITFISRTGRTAGEALTACLNHLNSGGTE